jgi:nitrite reductase (NADH) small subunit/3-phenylpropionate/trans-cinnamate dioxygenase ferredoxin subunit
MKEMLAVARTTEIPPGSAKVVMVRGRPLAVFHRPEGWRCLYDVCPHRGASLAEGEVVGGDVLCPWHSWPFSLADGRSNGSDFWKVDAFEAEAVDGTVYVRLPEGWPGEPV